MLSMNECIQKKSNITVEFLLVGTLENALSRISRRD
jgi:hypothetical protein